MTARRRRTEPVRRLAASLLLLAALTGASVPAFGDDSDAARQWLDRMAMAVNHLDYEGSLVYLRGESLEAMQVFHGVRDGSVRERLVSLTGVHREVIREGDSVRFIIPDEQSVLVDSRVADPWFPVIPPEQVADPGTRYEFRLGGTERIAGMDAQLLSIKPKDRFRYGYELWLDKNTGMLLKSRLLDQDGVAVEQLMFTELRIGGMVADADLEPGVADEDFLEVQFPSTEEAGPPSPDIGRWIVGEMPAGFTLRSHTHRAKGQSQHLEHMVFTDGLASVSVYVELNAEDGNPPPLGAGEIGAINVFGARFNTYSVTAIGEVPPATVQMMASSVRQAR